MSTSAVNPGVSNLLQSLANIGSPVLSSPTVQTALENAPPSDIVELSNEAMQMEGVDAMFGISDSSSDTASSAIQSLESSATGSSSSAASATAASSTTPSASSSAATSAATAAGYQADLQSEIAQALLGGSGSDTTGSLLDAVG